MKITSRIVRQHILVSLQPTPSMPLDIAANSAVNGDITPEVKNAEIGISYPTIDIQAAEQN